MSALRAAIPRTDVAARAADRASRSYREVATILLALRHECRTPEGQPDLKGRSHDYRATVRAAYEQTGLADGATIEKRLTVGVSYWVRKLLVERYGEAALRDMGVLPRRLDTTPSIGLDRLPKDPMDCLYVVAGVLNKLAADVSFVPSDDVIQSVARAITLLHRRASLKGADRVA